MMISTFTLDLRAILNRLLKNDPSLAIWMEKTDIYIDASTLGLYCTTFVIDCHYAHIAHFFYSNVKRLRVVLEPLAIAIRIQCRSYEVVAWENIGLELLESCTKLDTMLMDATLEAEQSAGTTSLVPTQQIATTQQQAQKRININGLDEPMRTFLIKQVENQNLPVYLNSSGGYDLPEMSFDIAWANLGDSLKAGSLFSANPNKSGNTDTANVDKGYRVSTQGADGTQKTTTPPRIIRAGQKFTGLDIKIGKNGSANTLKVFMSKLNIKNRTDSEILEAIANPSLSEYGQQLCAKLREAYFEKYPAMSAEKWQDIYSKISATAAQMINPTTEAVAEEEDS